MAQTRRVYVCPKNMNLFRSTPSATPKKYEKRNTPGEEETPHPMDTLAFYVPSGPFLQLICLAIITSRASAKILYAKFQLPNYNNRLNSYIIISQVSSGECLSLYLAYARLKIFLCSSITINM